MRRPAQAHRTNTLAGALTRVRRRWAVFTVLVARDAVPRTPGDVLCFFACSGFWLLFLYVIAKTLGVV